MKNSPRKKFLAITIFAASILLSSCSSSLKTKSNPTSISSNKKEINYIPASKEAMNLYRQIGISYFCLARQADVEFPKAISIASNNFSLIITKKHGGLIEEIGDRTLSIDQAYQGSYLQLIEGAIQLCPDQVPEDNKKKFLKAVEQINEKE